jgi:hypothetical protein
MKKRLLLLGILLFVGSTSTKAGSKVLTFSGLQCNEPVANYYNGGFGGDGSGPGPNYGVTFSSNSLALGDANTSCNGNFINEPSAPNILYFLSGTGDVMNDPGGITKGFSFFYSGNEAYGNGSVNIYSGLNGTGTLLASFVVNTSLTPYCGTGPGYCVWQPDGVSFSGTAESVVFGGAADFIGFDNITLGSSVAGATPEPSSLILFGTSLLGLVPFRRKLFGR